jgi:subfamily B ATP-binding cassette protein MsbA
VNAPLSSRQLYTRLLGHVRPYAGVFALAVLGMVAAAATEPLFPALIKPLLDRGFSTATGHSPAFYAGAIVGIFVLRGVLSFSSSYLLSWVSNKVVLDLRAAMFSRLVRLPARFLDDQASGQLLSKVAYDVSGVSGASTVVLTVVVKDSISVIGLLGYLLYLNWKLTLIAFVIAPPIALTVRIISVRLRRMSRGIQRSEGDIVSVLQESIVTNKFVKFLCGED